MTLTFRTLALLAGLGSAALLIGAFGFQHLGGFEPCAMCFWQRWPHGLAIVLALLALALPLALVALAGALTMLVSTGLAVFHTGVERHWWSGPTSCTARGGGLDTSECGLLDLDCGTPVVLCDQISWQFIGLSMANYNTIASLVLVAIWLMAARRT